MTQLENTAKRAIDLVAAASGLACLSPLLVPIAVLIRLDSPGPIFFRQIRLGRRGTRFTLLKFRTMQASAPLEIAADGHVVNFRDDSRHTRIGRILRRYSLDEIPQLFNILRGQMSLVGPRPDLPEALTFYSPVARTRLEVRPGMTGLAQLHGRNTLSPSQKWSWDAEYVRRASLRLDLKILAATISRTLQGDGLYRDAT